jgi:SNF2 family DNA or RNA helicase
MYRAIIVAPNNVRMNWEREFEKFKTIDGKCTVLRGGAIQRAKKLIDAFTPSNGEKFTVVICSYDTLCVSWEILKMIEWDLAVLDESHFIKSPQTRRFKFACKLRDMAKKRVILTGTPITNTALDLYAQLEFLGKGRSGFLSWKNFRSFYGSFRPGANGQSIEVGMQNLPFLKERLARMSFLIRKDEAMPDLPDKVYDVHEVEMTSQQAEIYESVRKHLAAEIEADLENASNKQLVVNNILTKLLRLAQITSGFVTWDAQYTDEGEVVKEKEVERLPNNPKVQAIIDILKEKKPNEKTLVWACWVSDIKAIEAACKEAGIDCVSYYGSTSEKNREEAEYRFNHDPNCKVFIGNPAAGGVGLNLLGYPPGCEDDFDTNADHVIYFSQNWSPTARSQSEDRAHRRGTRNNVRITDLCVPGTIDEEIRARVLKKRINAYEIADIKNILESVLKGVV